jgi:hypothetical protein
VRLFFLTTNSVAVLALLITLLAGCTEGQKPTPLKRTPSSASRPAEEKAAKEKSDKPAKETPDKAKSDDSTKPK